MSNLYYGDFDWFWEKKLRLEKERRSNIARELGLDFCNCEEMIIKYENSKFYNLNIADFEYQRFYKLLEKYPSDSSINFIRLYELGLPSRIINELWMFSGCWYTGLSKPFKPRISPEELVDLYIGLGEEGLLGYIYRYLNSDNRSKR